MYVVGLLHFLFVLFPIFTYQFLFLDKFHVGDFRVRQYVMGFLGGISGILCMTYPLYITEGFFLDMRWISFIIVILYAGLRGFTISVLMVMVYRFYLGGDGFFNTLIVIFLMSVVVFLFRKRYLISNRYKKIILGAGLSLYAYMLVIGLISFSLNRLGFRQELYDFYSWDLLFGTALFSTMTMVIAIYLTESVYENFVLRGEIQNAEKLTLISEMAASIAHEVRNPLTVVKGFLQLSKPSVDPKVQGYLNTALAELQRAEGIINDYLNFAKPHRDKLEVFEVAVTLQNVLNIMYSFGLMYAVELKEHCEPNLWIRGEKDKLKQALLNIVKNAIEAIPEGGEVRVKTFSQGNMAVIVVSDEGDGMSRAQLERLGNPFYTTKEKGTGLGVMVTRRLIETMGGTIDFYSELGKGTTVQITLPLAQ